jgi:hypothetical protein|tara:strand:+ start:951 stop:1079 length:129 start_codon:yes stop_codon:yes gene_type:complete
MNVINGHVVNSEKQRIKIIKQDNGSKNLLKDGDNTSVSMIHG